MWEKGSIQYMKDHDYWKYLLILLVLTIHVRYENGLVGKRLEIARALDPDGFAYLMVYFRFHLALLYRLLKGNRR
jgi:hypothetical protein